MINCLDKNLYFNGRTKQIYTTSDNQELAIRFKDDTLTFFGIKKAFIPEKGKITGLINQKLFTYLNENGIKTHYLENISDDVFLCIKTEVLPLGLVMRNVAAGKYSEKFWVAEGTPLKNPVFELCYRSEDLGNPMINDYQALALELVSKNDLEKIYEIAKTVNELLKNFFNEKNLLLVDLKIRFGKNALGEILVIDELTPDVARIWDKKTKERLDKDVLKLDLGDIKKSYKTILDRIL